LRIQTLRYSGINQDAVTILERVLYFLKKKCQYPFNIDTFFLKSGVKTFHGFLKDFLTPLFLKVAKVAKWQSGNLKTSLN
jgi:hypothetical protein